MSQSPPDVAHACVRSSRCVSQISGSELSLLLLFHQVGKRGSGWIRFHVVTSIQHKLMGRTDLRSETWAWNAELKEMAMILRVRLGSCW